MDRWIHELRDDLARLEASHRLRRLTLAEPVGRFVRIDGRDLLNLAGNDYLGLADHPRLKQAAIAAIHQHGTGAGASRLLVGHQPWHAAVEARFAAFKHAEAALLCPTGYMANLAAITALCGPGDLLCADKLNHASLIDAARLSGATLRVFPHREHGKLERLLATGIREESVERRASSVERKEDEGGTGAGTLHAPRLTLHVPRPARRLIVTDSIFSMDGDAADLPALCDLADRYGAILIVDEAHATGILGADGSGLCELQGVTQRVDVVISTASKALGGLGGIITARREVIDTLVNRARSFIYTTAVPPAQTAVIDAALDVLRDEPWRRQRLVTLATYVRDELSRLDLPASVRRPRKPTPHTPPPPPTPIIPLLAGAPEAALALAGHLRAAGLYAPAIRPPTVPPGTSRVRLSLRADLEDADVARLLDALRKWGKA